MPVSPPCSPAPPWPPRRRTLQTVDGLVFHARGATQAHLVDAVAAATGTDLPPGNESGGLLERLEQHPGTRRLIIMLDALDEAASSPERTGICDLLNELSQFPWCTVVAATRPLETGDWFRPGSLLRRLGVTNAAARNLIDLDVKPFQDPQALRQFSAALLTQTGVTRPGPLGCAWETYRLNAALTHRLAEAIARRADQNFLVAALTAASLSTSEDVIDPDAANFQPQRLSGSVGEAIDKYLDALPDTDRPGVLALLDGPGARTRQRTDRPTLAEVRGRPGLPGNPT